MILGGRDLTRERILVAEIGNNHEGDVSMAKEMVHAAAEAGADAVKVQVITPERLVNVADSARIAQLTRFSLSQATFEEMAAIAQSKGVLFIATPFDRESLGWLVKLVPAIKIASGDLDYTQLLAAAARTGKPVILSTGMGTLSEIRRAVDVIRVNLPPGRSVSESLIILHCISSYPTPLKEANLRAIGTLRQVFALTTGYSDHTLGIEAAIVAACLGARVIEKHFTLDKRRTTFRDHALSADPGELERLATVLHSLDDMLGDGEKRAMPCEFESVARARRSIVAARDLSEGTRLTFDDLEFVRPRDGLPPFSVDGVIGRQLKVGLRRHQPILESHLV